MSKNHTLNPYRDLLNASDIACGINAAIKNSNRLLEDAKILEANGSCATALSVAVLSIEEAGKISILRRLAICKDQKEAINVWREYRSHRSKNAAWVIQDLVNKGARKLEDFKDCVDSEGEHTAIIDGLKQLGFYTDCLGNKNWSLPSDVIDASLTKSILDVAELLCPDKDKEVTTQEIQFWINCLEGSSDLRAGIVQWHAAMLAAGLTDVSAEKFYKFIYGENGAEKMLD